VLLSKDTTMLPIAHYFVTENAQGLQIVGDYTLAPKAKGWVILQHGFSSSRATSLQTQVARLACLAANYNVIQFDTTHSFGASEGALEHCTAHTAYADLCAVVDWAKAQTFCGSAQFILGGASLGGLCVGHYAQQNPDDVCGLILMCPVILGDMFVADYKKISPKII
jgi:pimeloyl-ACP methyl ester carboxylesterase